MPAGPKFDAKARARFLKHYAENGRITHAAMAAGVTRFTVLNHRKSDPEFEAAFQEAHGQFCDRYLKHVDNLCLDGVKRAVYFQGVKCGEEIEFPIPLIQMRARSLFPEMREKQEIALSGRLQVETQSTEELKAEAALLAAKLGIKPAEDES